LFDTLTDSFKNAINKIRFADNQKSLKNILTELRKSLLRADVYHSVVKYLLLNIEKDLKQFGIGKDNFLKSLRKNLLDILTTNQKHGFIYSNKPPTVVLFSGLQGSGKTTTCGKLANHLKQKNKKVLLVAADLQRLAAVEQLRQISQQIEVDIHIDEKEKNPSIVAKNALKKAKELFYDVVIVDTAGRLAIDDDLINELKDIKKVLSPDEVFYVADSLSGQDAVKSVRTFNEKIELTGIIFSKYDGDAKGGIAVSIAKQTDIPLRFIGTGEKMSDLEVFVPERIVGRLMGEGDIEGLAEKTSLAMDEKSMKKVSSKIKKGKFNFNDFVSQLDSMKKLGNMKSIVSMIPGASSVMKNLGDMDLDNSTEINMTKAMIGSMTPKERENPDLLNNSRKRRISSGAGLDIIDVNRSIKQFKNAAKMMKRFSKGGEAGMQNMFKELQAKGVNR
jgi:signal recognition particle subunit SRP54